MSASTFDAKYAEEKVVLTFDFSAALGAGETVSAIASLIVQAYGVDGNLGSDTAPSSLLNGGASLDGTSKKVLQPVQAGKPGASYLFTVVVNTSAGNVLELKGILPILSV